MWFTIFVLALQQLDGNVIGPKILGNTTGLSSLWVIIAILVGGGLFGIVGMFIGVPVCAVLYALLWNHIRRSLERRNLPLEEKIYETSVYLAGGGKKSEKNVENS